MDLNLVGKNALVTGGSHGIGKAVALLLSKEGCNVSICSRSEGNLYSTAKEIKSCLPIQADLSVSEERDRVIETIKKEYDHLDILINNVGGGGRWGKVDVLKTQRKVWDEVFEKNVATTIDFTLGFIPSMIDRNWGRVISITSIYGRQIGGRPWFNAAKFAQSTIMANLSTNRDFVRHGITFNSIAPGPIMIPDTGLDKERINDPVEFNKKMEACPAGKFGVAQDVAEITVFICSDRAKHINGAVIPVDGGESTVL